MLCATGSLMLAITACAPHYVKKPPKEIRYGETGIASWYGAKFAGRKTASGERYKPSAMTAAHRTLPFGTMVKVTNLTNNKSVIVRINDRGPYIKGRIIDLSKAAAQELEFIKKGIAKVRITAL